MKKTNILKTMAAATLTTLYACNSEQADFNQEWEFWSDAQVARQVINLPHDAMQTETRSNEVPEGRHNGFYPGNVYHYEKTFKANADWLQKHVTLAFEGVYHHSKVFVNGKEAGGYHNGYMPFEVCLDGLLVAGDNTIRVDVDNAQVPNSRWYSGAGIYRPVHFIVQETDFIEQLKIITLSIAPAKVKVETLHQGGEVAVAIYQGDNMVASADGDLVELNIDNALLWSAESPNLYKAVVELKKDGKVIEQQTKHFGIREITWSTQGLQVNGNDVLLRGGCLHHDNGILGAAEYDDAAYRKVALLKEYGFNAIRSSHNPLSEAMLKACDELGMYVMDELWDMWYITKTKFDYSNYFYDNYVEDIRQFVKKDFNHPSVIMYSIGNEVGEPAEEKGVALAKELIDRLHQADNLRPVSAGINLMIIGMTKMGMNIFEQSNAAAAPGGQQITSEQYNMMMSASSEQMLKASLSPMIDEATTPVLDALDIAGYNYASPRYAIEGELHPNRVIFGSETFPYDLAKSWAQVEQLPYLVGDFMWTAIDYIGEIGLGAWFYSDDANFANKTYPWKLNGGGAIDLIGNPTGEALWAKAIWTKHLEPSIGVQPIHKEKLIKSMWRGTNSIPSWSWQGCEGMTTQVEVFTAAPKVKLFVNDQEVGEQATNDYRAVFEHVTYEPGTLKAVAIAADGKEYECALTSATGKVGISIEPEINWSKVKGLRSKADGQGSLFGAASANDASIDLAESRQNRTQSMVNAQWSMVNEYRAGDLIFLDINLMGENGVVESKADRDLTVTVEGADLLGYGSQALITEAAFLDGTYPTYYGQSMAVIRAVKPGNVTISVSGDGLETVQQVIAVK